MLIYLPSDTQDISQDILIRKILTIMETVALNQNTGIEENRVKMRSPRLLTKNRMNRIMQKKLSH